MAVERFSPEVTAVLHTDFSGALDGGTPRVLLIAVGFPSAADTGGILAAPDTDDVATACDVGADCGVKWAAKYRI